MDLVAAALAAAISNVVPAHAGGECLDIPNKPWFENLQRPDNHLAPHRNIDPKSLFCCGIADTVKTKFKVKPGNERYPEDRWHAWLDNRMGFSAAGKDCARLCARRPSVSGLLADTIQCFVRPRGGL
jgi:hypothetical protein